MWTTTGTRRCSSGGACWTTRGPSCAPSRPAATATVARSSTSTAMAGPQELLLGAAVYNNDCSLRLTLAGAWVGVADVDLDGEPEFVTTVSGYVRLMEADGTLTWQTAHPRRGRRSAQHRRLRRGRRARDRRRWGLPLRDLRRRRHHPVAAHGVRFLLPGGGQLRVRPRRGWRGRGDHRRSPRPVDPSTGGTGRCSCERGGTPRGRSGSTPTWWTSMAMATPRSCSPPTTTPAPAGRASPSLVMRTTTGCRRARCGTSTDTTSTTSTTISRCRCTRIRPGATHNGFALGIPGDLPPGAAPDAQLLNEAVCFDACATSIDLQVVVVNGGATPIPAGTPARALCRGLARTARADRGAAPRRERPRRRSRRGPDLDRAHRGHRGRPSAWWWWWTTTAAAWASRPSATRATTSW